MHGIGGQVEQGLLHLRGVGQQRRQTGLELGLQPTEHTSHMIDIAADAGPQRYQPGPAAGGSQRYCSVARLKAPMMRFAAQYRRPEGVPEWLGQCPASKGQVEAASDRLEWPTLSARSQKK